MDNLIATLEKKVHALLEQLVFDAELYVISEYHVKMIEEYLEFFSYGLSILLKDGEGIFWLEDTKEGLSFVIMPRLVEDILKKEVFSQAIPFIFSSATLSRGGDFTYIAKSLGIERFSSFTVASPFDYEENMKVIGMTESSEGEKWESFGRSLRKNNGESLVLFNSEEEMNRFREWAKSQQWEFSILYEGDREISETVASFQHERSAVLCAYHLWEGLDVPGESLTQVLISSLPFPPLDPVFQAKRKHAKHPQEDVDIPYMFLRLRQGIGRLIRSQQDHGLVQIWVTEEEKKKHRHEMEEVVPVKIMWD